MNSNIRFQGHSLNICVNHNALANICGKGKNFTFRFDNLRCNHFNPNIVDISGALFILSLSLKRAPDMSKIFESRWLFVVKHTIYWDDCCF